jgi:hypothetical protein
VASSLERASTKHARLSSHGGTGEVELYYGSILV